MATSLKRLTYADFEKIPSDGFRHEIIEGKEFITPAPSLEHQTVVLTLGALLRAHVISRKLGRVFVAPTDVVLSEHNIVEPDILLVSEQHLAILSEKNIQGPPDLVIEVLSASTAAEDRGPKLELYSRSGVGEYWMVDLAGKTIEVREFGSPRRTRIYQTGQSFESTKVTGLTLRVNDIFSL